MGRLEKPLDPAAGPVQQFAYELRKLRREAGTPTYRRMAADARYSAPTLSAAASGERLPSLPVTLAYVAACGGEPAPWERRWREAAAAEEPAPDDPDAASPYPGLRRFEPGDAFFGRADLVAELVELVGSRRFTAVVGASGSGKSSLLRAGLVPALRAAPGARPATIRILTPGARPVRTHAARLATVVAGDGDGDGGVGHGCDGLGGDTVIVVDQFEEIFTLCHDPAERAEFIRLLLTGGARVVVAVRADLYGRCAEHRALAGALRNATLLVGPMTRAQLREAIVGPAVAERLIVERALTARIVADVADEPGGLPLMAHALREVWRRRRGRALTVAAYETVGGVQGAIAHTAEEVFTGFTPAQARTARALLLRLISPGDGTQDTRRPVAREELGTSAETADVLERLVRARLLTADTSTVDLAHEALLTAWPRLRGWIDEDRERLRLHRRLTEAAYAWEELGRDPGALYRGTRLASARETFVNEAEAVEAVETVETVETAGPTESAELTGLERSFLTASLAEHDRTRRTAARTTRRLRGLTGTLAVLLCLAVVAGLTVRQQSRTASRHATEAEARRVAAVAGTLRRTDPRTAMRLSLAAWRLADLPETRTALYGANAQQDLDTFAAPAAEFTPQDDNTHWQRFSEDGRTLTVIGPERTDRWDVPTHRRLPPYPGLGRYAGRIVDVSPDTRTAAVRTPAGLRMWDVAAGRLTGPAFGPKSAGAQDWFTQGSFTQDGDVFAAHHRGAPLQLWDPHHGRLLLSTGQRYREIRKIAVGPGGRLLAFCGDDRPLQVWDVRTHRELPSPWATKAGVCDLDTFRFTPDGGGLAVATAHALRTWDLRTGRERFHIPTSATPDAVFSADGSQVAVLTPDEIRLWDLSDLSAPVHSVPTNGVNLHDLRLDPASGTLRYQDSVPYTPAIRTVAPTGTAQDRSPRTSPRSPPAAARFSPDGRTLATLTSRGFELRDGRTGRLRSTSPGRPDCGGSCSSSMSSMAFSQDGSLFAHLDAASSVAVRPVAGSAGETRLPPRPDVVGLAFTGRTVVTSGTTTAVSSPAPGARHWSTLRNGQDGAVLATAPDGELLTEERQLIKPRTGRARRVMHGEGVAVTAAFSPDGRCLAMSDYDGRTTLWDGTGTHRLAVLAAAVPAEGARSRARALAFSADSRTVAVGGPDGALHLWNTSSPESAGSPLPPADGAVLALSFAAGDTALRVTTPRTVVRTYGLAPEKTAGTVCARAGGGLSRKEWDAYLTAVAYRRTC
ncbi:hypothetical protein [Streptomyces sp. NBC_01500]|uniref:nSTAND1 domain-containing NTPase n=1 Tax=Streptomyces sp. NBC_01500 TaxID=2903886 RepID=UPI0022597F97|nr:hypothetical protein [Streptomyces sp. NBC_01500]MCX4549881.1 hypothetical protein [Streptomyces sp. NBC_01500]